MKRILLIIIPWAMLIMIFIALSGSPFEDKFPDAAYEKLHTYVIHNPILLLGVTRIITIEKAQYPGLFSRDMSYGVVTDQGFRSTNLQYGGEKISFPPDSLWCILLESDVKTIEGQKVQSVVFVAWHNTLYTSDLYVHEGETVTTNDRDFLAYSYEFRETLKEIGCHSLIQ